MGESCVTGIYTKSLKYSFVNIAHNHGNLIHLLLKALCTKPFQDVKMLISIVTQKLRVCTYKRVDLLSEREKGMFT